ncbi:MAG: LamG-like jellyroll fold domain-containing protein, partial [Phycisphaerae bacterium]
MWTSIAPQARQNSSQPIQNKSARRPNRRELQLAADAASRFEALESRTLLSITFANLGYTDPFPAAGSLGQPAQTTLNIYTESFTDQTATTNTGMLNDHYWTGAGTGTITRALPTWLQGTAGLQQMSVEFWLKVNTGTNVGWGKLLELPGLNVFANFNWGPEPAGILMFNFMGDTATEPLQIVPQNLGVVADGQWHQYAATFDTKTAYFYMDGQLQSQNWVTNSITQIGPQNVNTLSTTTPTAITYTGFNLPSGGLDEVRISDVALTPAQVKRNFENYRPTPTTWYASPTGLSTNAGTRVSPLDLTTALTHATADNKIVLLAGTYDGSQFRVTTSGNSFLHNALITGDDYTAGTAGQAIIQTTGTTQGALISTGVQYVTLRNLTFATDQSAALAFSGAGRGNVVDGCRITSNAAGLTVTNSPGYTDPLPTYTGSSGQHFFEVPGVTLENSVVAPGVTGTAVSFVNSPVVVMRNNTIVGGTIGASFTTATTNVSLLDNIFEGQTSAGVYFSSDSLLDGVAGGDGSQMPSYAGDGNIYHPGTGGYVATVVNGLTTNNYTSLNDFAQFWYV